MSTTKRKPLVRTAPKPPAELKNPGEVNAFCSGVILAGNAGSGNQNPGPDYVYGLKITAWVQPADADFIITLAEELGFPVEIVAGVLTDLGDAAMRNSAMAARVVEDEIPHVDSSRFIWRCIHREAEDYSAAVPVTISCDGQESLYEVDAQCMGRDVGDWIGTIIGIGVRVAKSPAAVKYWSRAGLQSLFAAAAYEINKKGGIAA